MTFLKVLIISLLCYTKLIYCQAAKPKFVWIQDFFNYQIKVDYTTCDHDFYPTEYDEEFQSDSDFEGDGSGYEDYDMCLRYC